MKHTRIWAIILLGWTIQLTAQPTIINTLADSGPGSLRLAIFNSSPGDTIVMSPSLIANGSDTLYFTSYIYIPHSLSIIGAMNNTDTLFFSGNNATRLFEINRVGLSSVDVYFEQVAFVESFYNNNGNYSSPQGVALQIIGPGNFTFLKCVFKENYGTNGSIGGAFYIKESNLIVDSVRFIRNVIDSNMLGGAMRISLSQVEIKNSHFYNNSARLGADIFAGGSSKVHIDNSEFFGFNAPLDVSIWMAGENLVIENSYFFNQDRVFFEVTNPTKRFVLKNNNFISTGNSIIYNSEGINCKTAILENNTLESFMNSPGIYIEFFDTLILNKNTLIYSNSGSNLHGRDLRIYPQNSTLPLSSQVMRINNNTFLLNKFKPSDPGVLITYKTGVNLIISNNVFSTISNKLTLKVTENSSSSQVSTPASDGYNIFSDNNPNAIATDLTLVDSVQLALEPLGYYGGITPTRIPKPNSVALNSGNPNNFSPAQNGPIYGIRDRGAAERPVITNDTISSCFGPVTWWGNTFTNPGVYRDTAANANSLDSTGVLVLTGLEAALVNNGGLLTASANEPSTFQWINCSNGQVINTGATFLPASNGSYAAVATAGSCIDTTECVAYNEVSLDEQSTPRVVVYPNPTAGLLHVAVNGGAVTTGYVLLDLQGRVLRHGALKHNAINLHGLPAGTYLLRINLEDGTQLVQRVVHAF